MMSEVLCWNCRELRPYTTTWETRTKSIDEIEVSYEVQHAYCTICKEEITVPGMVDENLKRMEEAYYKLRGEKRRDDT